MNRREELLEHLAQLVENGEGESQVADIIRYELEDLDENDVQNQSGLNEEP